MMMRASMIVATSNTLLFLIILTHALMGMSVMIMMTSMMVEMTKPDKQAPC